MYAISPLYPSMLYPLHRLNPTARGPCSAVLRTRADWCPNPRGSAAAEAPLSLSAVLRSNLGSGAEARADLAVQQRAATCPHAGGAGQAQQPAAVTPLLLGVQAGSTASHRAPLAWRCGVLQVGRAIGAAVWTGCNGV